jgi:hypothetical protein
MRADARRKRRLVLLALLCGACTLDLSKAGPSIDVAAPRLLDELCKTGAYTLTGTAVRTAGLTEDSCGFELGPGPGEVAFEVEATGGGPLTTTKLSGLLVDIDADGPKNARWVPVAPDDVSSGGPLTQTVAIRTTDRRIGVVDLEVWTETVPEASCSMARAPGIAARSRRAARR